MIKAVMFDMGGTLEDISADESNAVRTAHELYRIITEHGITVPYGEQELWEIVLPEILRYKKEAEGTLIELKPEQIWLDHGFKHVPLSDEDKKKLVDCSEEIAYMWEVTYFNRKLREHAAEMLAGLKSLGLYVAAVSNTASLFQVFDTLKQYGVRQYFDDITLSSITGYRKPHPYIFRTALCQADLPASECAFVGDTLSRDVIGPRKMGYGMIFKINSWFTPQKDMGRNWDGVEPDYQVTDIYDVYRILKELLGK